MKKILILSAALFVFSAPAFAQWQTPEHSVPVGRGNGTGFKSFGPCASNIPFIGKGPSADPACAAITLPSAVTAGDIMYGTSSNVIGRLPIGPSGTIVRSNGTSPAYSTATYPNTATSAGTILRADGTNWVASTATWPDGPGTLGQLLVSNGTGYAPATIALDAALGKIPVGLGTGTAGFSDSGVGTTFQIPSAYSSLITTPTSIDVKDYYSLLDFGDARAQMALPEASRNLASALTKALSSGEKIYVPPGRYPLKPIDSSLGYQVAVLINADTPIDVTCAQGATFVIPADWGVAPGTLSVAFALYATSSPSPTGTQVPFSFKGCTFDGTAYTAAYGAQVASVGAGLEIFDIYRYWMPTFENNEFKGGVTTPDVATVGVGSLDSAINTHQTISDRIINNYFSGFYDLAYYPSGVAGDFELGANPITASTSGNETLAWTANQAIIGDQFVLDGVVDFAGTTGWNRQYGVLTAATNSLGFTKSGVSSDATGGGSSVVVNNLSRSSNISVAAFKGIDYIFSGNFVYRSNRGVSAKRNWRTYQVLNNIFYECNYGVTAEAGGHVGGEGTQATISGNKFFFTQTNPIHIVGGPANHITNNFIQDFGFYVYDPTTPTAGTASGGYRVGIMIESPGAMISTGNIIKQTNWTTNPGGTTYQIGIYVKATQAGAIAPAYGIYRNDRIVGVYQGVLETDGTQNFFDEKITGDTLASSYSGTNTASMTYAAGSITLTGATWNVPDVAYSASWDGSTAVPTRNAVYDAFQAGRWTPTVTGTANVASVTAQSSHYSKVGSIVTFAVTFNITATAASSTVTTATISLPAALTSNFASTSDAAGNASIGISASGYTLGTVSADTTNDVLTMTYQAQTTSATVARLTGSYEIK